ncbi:MAG: DUF2490 domain-containing protein [Verrucomicrobiae bacterium]|nr:DUF2490 domain-containing protein [Verrucomicrobiae bacterium]
MMRLPSRFSIFLVLASAAGWATMAPPSLAADGDWQQWSEASWIQTLGHGLDIGLRWQGRWEEDVSRFAYHETEPMLIWRHSPRWDFQLGYERDERFSPVEEVAHVPNVSAVLRLPRQPWKLLPILDWRLSNAFRMEFMISETGASDWTPAYRNRTEWETRWKWGGKELIPYVFEEWLVDLRAGEFVQNRLGIGLGVPIVPHWLARVWWMRFDEKVANAWEWHPVIGVQIQTQF